MITKSWNFQERKDCTCTLRKFMFTLTEKNLKKAAKLMGKYRGLTIPNRASACIFFTECRIMENSFFKYVLLTGKDIIKGLKELKENDQEVKENLYQNNRYSFD